jgi:hypothetical protein
MNRPIQSAAVFVSTILAGCDESQLNIDLTCTFIDGSDGREASTMNIAIDLDEPKVTLADGVWIYGNRPAGNVYGEDTISIRRVDDTGVIIMSAIRADVPVLLRLNLGDGTMFYSYALNDGLHWFRYDCR